MHKAEFKRPLDSEWSFFVCVWNNIKKMFHVKQILGINDVMVAVACFDVIDGGAYESKYGDCSAITVV